MHTIMFNFLVMKRAIFTKSSTCILSLNFIKTMIYINYNIIYYCLSPLYLSKGKCYKYTLLDTVSN